MKEEGIIIHTDGGARGNPGPAACAFVVEDGEKILHKDSKNLGINTNNFAEYSAVVLALEWLVNNKQKLAGRNVYFYSDSELIVKQINGQYKIKNEILKLLNATVVKLRKQSGLNILFKNILRHENKIADQLVNDELDK
jgi:ribonuclease HI